MFAFIKKIIHYDYLYRNKLKKNLSKYDFSLIAFLKIIHFNTDTLNFFDKSISDYIIDESIDPFLIFRKQSITRNHDRIAIQLLIKIMQTNQVIFDKNYRYHLTNAFKTVGIYYSNQKYKQICMQYIKDDWRDCFYFYNNIKPDFVIRLYKYYNTYNQNYYNNQNYNNQNYYNAFNNCFNKSKNQKNTISLLKSHFDKLGIEMTKDISIIKSQYRKLCLIHHPDKGGDKNMFISITESYNYILQHIND